MAVERKKPGRVVTPEHLGGPPSEETMRQDEERRRKYQEQKMREQQALDARIQAMIDGKEPIPNEIVKYLIDELRDTNAEKAAVGRNAQQYEQGLAQSRKRLVELNGIIQKYFSDIAKQVQKAASPVEQAAKKLEAVPEVKEEEHAEPDPEPAV